METIVQRGPGGLPPVDGGRLDHGVRDRYGTRDSLPPAAYPAGRRGEPGPDGPGPVGDLSGGHPADGPGALRRPGSPPGRQCGGPPSGRGVLAYPPGTGGAPVLRTAAPVFHQQPVRCGQRQRPGPGAVPGREPGLVQVHRRHPGGGRRPHLRGLRHPRRPPGGHRDGGPPWTRSSGPSTPWPERKTGSGM